MQTPATKNVVIREAVAKDFPAVRQCMADVFGERPGQKTRDFSSALWHWQYLEAEHGSLVLLAEDDGLVCGYYHAVILPMVHDGRNALAAMVQDVGTRSSHRKRGIFRQMGRLALELLDRRGVDFIYTFPNVFSLPSFVRDHQYTVVTQVPVYAAPLRAGPLCRERLHLGHVGEAFGMLLDPLLHALLLHREPLQKGEEIRRISEFDGDILPIRDELMQRTRIALDRTPPYLNWRFFRKPTHEYSGWGIRRDGGLQAYVVMRAANIFSVDCTLLMDFGCRAGERSTLCRLVSECLRVEMLSGRALAVTMGSHPDLIALQKAGFIRLPGRFNPRIFNLVVKNVGGDTGRELLDPANWTMTLADWDVY